MVARSRMTASAIGERQMFPKQTAVMRNGVDRGDREDTAVMLFRRAGQYSSLAGKKGHAHILLSVQGNSYGHPTLSPRCPQPLGGCPQEVHRVVDSARGHTSVASVPSRCCGLHCHRSGYTRCDDCMMMVCGAEEGVHR